VRSTGLRLEAAGITDRGSVRSDNEDRWQMRRLGRDALVAVVADGMGGHAGGAAAATLAVEAVMRTLARVPDPHAGLVDAFTAAGASVRRMRAGRERPGTTLVAAVVSPERTTVANVGDSRAYLLHDSRPLRITTDHSWVAVEVAAGRMDAAQAAVHPARSHLVRAITGDPVEVDVFSLTPVAGDVVVLCSDGVWGVLDDRRLAAPFGATGALADQVQQALRAALAAGSRDNVTVVACRVEREEVW